MFEWKYLELSPEDYENYVTNEDQQQMQLNDFNIQEWQTLYHEAQKRALHNKSLKKHVLAFENAVRRMLSNPNNGESLLLSTRLTQELRLHLTPLFDQLGLLHLRNISTTVEFTISRLLSIKQEFFKVLYEKQKEILELKERVENAEIKNREQICIECHETQAKTKHRYLTRQILGIEGIDQQEQEENTGEKMTIKEEKKKEQQDYQLGRYCFLSSIEEVLRGRQKALKSSSAPLQQLLSDYLQQVLEMLDGQKLGQPLQNLKQYDRVNRSYHHLQDMKGLINFPALCQKAVPLLREPLKHFMQLVQKPSAKIQISSLAIQTDPVQKTSDRQVRYLTTQLEALKLSKKKGENELLANLQNLHKTELKNMQLNSRNRQIQIQSKRLEAELQSLKSKFQKNEAAHKQDQERILENNLMERTIHLQQIRRLQQRLKKERKQRSSIRFQRIDKQERGIQVGTNSMISSEDITFAGLTSLALNDERRQKKTIMRRRGEKKLSIRLEQTRQISRADQEKLSGMGKNYANPIEQLRFTGETGARSSQESKFQRSKQNLGPQRWQRRQHNAAGTLRICSVNPLQTDQNLAVENNEHPRSSLLINLPLPQTQRARSKKITDIKFNHGYCVSELQPKQPSDAVNSSKMSLAASRVQLGPTKLQIITNRKFPNRKMMPSRKQNKQPFPLRNSKSNDLLSIFSPSGRNSVEEKEVVSTLATPLLLTSASKIKTEAKADGVKNHQEPPKDKIKELVECCMSRYHELQSAGILDLITNINRTSSQQIMKKVLAFKIQDIKVPQRQIQAFTVSSSLASTVIKLFFGNSEAQRYEKGQGIWYQMDQCLMVDTNFKIQSEAISLQFDHLSIECPQKYKKITHLLLNPSSWRRKKENQTKMNSMQVQQIFRRLLRLHKMMHRRCNHVHDFLKMIGLNCK